MNTVEKSMRFVELVKSPYLQVYPDSGNNERIIRTWCKKCLRRY